LLLKKKTTTKTNKELWDWHAVSLLKWPACRYRTIWIEASHIQCSFVPTRMLTKLFCPLIQTLDK
jgi:hypothetical protein